MNNPNNNNQTPGTKTDITNLTIDRFLLGLNLMRNKKQPVYRLATVQITEADRKTIKDAIDLRNTTNANRKVFNSNLAVTEIECMQREPEHKVDEKGMFAEILFSQVIKKIEGNAHIPGFEVETPPIAEKGKLDKSKQDVVITDTENKQSLTFDIKGTTADAKYFNVNKKAYERMEEQNADFMIAGIINSNAEEIESANSITFYYLDRDFFFKNAEARLKFKNPKRTPHYALPIEKIKSKTLN